MEVDKELKRKITQRWNILSREQSQLPFACDPEAVKAFAQLEYLLLEAGLLARTRKKRHEFGKIPSLQGDHTRETSPGDRPAIDDNTIGLSEEVGRNYGE